MNHHDLNHIRPRDAPLSNVTPLLMQCLQQWCRWVVFIRCSKLQVWFVPFPKHECGTHTDIWYTVLYLTPEPKKTSTYPKCLLNFPSIQERRRAYIGQIISYQVSLLEISMHHMLHKAQSRSCKRPSPETHAVSCLLDSNCIFALSSWARTSRWHYAHCLEEGRV